MPAASSRKNQQSQFPREAFEARDLYPGLGMKGMQYCISFMIHHSFFRMGAAEEMAGFCAAVHKTLRIFSSQYMN